MVTLDVGFEKLGLARQRVIETILNPLRGKGHYRHIAKGTSVAFDPSRVWLIERGEISVEYLDRPILTLCQGDVVRTLDGVGRTAISGLFERGL